MNDVVVYGATSAGVCAAVAAAERGARVTLLEPGRHVGGMTSGGLGHTDLGDLRVVGGFAARFRQCVADRYRVAVGAFAGPEPHVAEQILQSWLDESGVTLIRQSRLASVVRAGTALERLVTTDGRSYDAAVFVDASYEGDLLAAAGVSHSVGREDRSLYGERWAGRQELLPGRHNIWPVLSPFAADPHGFAEGALLPGVCARPLVDVGTGDGGVMAYGYRVCLTKAADRLEVEPPHDYDPNDFELLRRIISWYERHDYRYHAGWYLGLEPNLPGRKCDGNSLGPFSLNLLDGTTWDYPSGSPEKREQIRLAHLHHTRGFLYFLGHDPSVPQRIRNEILTWGLPRDEFIDTDHLPHQLYVREARRMRGETVLVEQDLFAGTAQPDAVAMGSYHIDIREVQRTWAWLPEHPNRYARVFTEGYLSVPVPPYQIPYRAMLPSRDEATNLLVSVCVSASHVAFASIRMEPQYMMLGQAAGEAAVLAPDGRVHEVEIGLLQQRLCDRQQILAL